MSIAASTYTICVTLKIDTTHHPCQIRRRSTTMTRIFERIFSTTDNMIHPCSQILSQPETLILHQTRRQGHSSAQFFCLPVKRQCAQLALIPPQSNLRPNQHSIAAHTMHKPFLFCVGNWLLGPHKMILFLELETSER